MPSLAAFSLSAVHHREGFRVLMPQQSQGIPPSLSKIQFTSPKMFEIQRMLPKCRPLVHATLKNSREKCSNAFWCSRQRWPLVLVVTVGIPSRFGTACLSSKSEDTSLPTSQANSCRRCSGRRRASATVEAVKILPVTCDACPAPSAILRNHRGMYRMPRITKKSES